MTPSSSIIGVGLIGAGRIGTSHAQILAERVPGAQLTMVADTRTGAAGSLADRFGADAVADPLQLIKDNSVDAVVIAASAEAHADLIVACASAGKPIFCEKPASLTLQDSARSLAAVEAAGVILQVGFNRRFARDFRAAHDAIVRGAIGMPQLLRSLTRDPGLANPGAVPPGGE